MSESPIYFRSKDAEYSWLSNFHSGGFEESGLYWPTVEHYFQAQKFDGPDQELFREQIRNCGGPFKAKQLGKSKDFRLRTDWDRTVDGMVVKEQVMLHALRLKFSDPGLREKLLQTGKCELVEVSRHDTYWAKDLSGKYGNNRLGILLMMLRDELRGSEYVDGCEGDNEVSEN